MNASQVEVLFWEVMSECFDRPVGPEHLRVEDLEEWDSMRHIGLILELEEAFDIEVDPERIGELYTGTDVILDYLLGVTGASR